MLFAYAVRLQYDEETIKDCLQELFVKIHLNGSKLQALPHVRSYLYTSILNALIDKKRKKSPLQNSVPIEFIELTYEDIEQCILFEQDDKDLIKKRKLLESIQKLSKNQQNALYLYYIQEFSWEEMSLTLNISQHSCMNLVGRSVTKLRKIILEK